MFYRVTRKGIFALPLTLLTPVGVTPTATPIQTTGGTCNVSYAVSSQWPGVLGANVPIRNIEASALNGWSLGFSFPNGQTITQFWNGSYTRSGGNITFNNVSYNRAIASGGNTAFGFDGAWNGTNTAPTAFKFNGVSCSVS